jgi:hypothetical protein
MKTAFRMILFRNFWRENAGWADTCDIQRKLSFRSAGFGREESAIRWRQKADSSAFAALRVGMTKLKRGLAECECQLETDHYRFRFQSHTPDFLDALLDLIFQPENLGGAGPAAVYEG